MQCQLQIINGSVASLNYLIAHLTGSLVFDVAYRRPSSPKKNFKKLFFLIANLVRPNLPKFLTKKFGKDGLTKFAKIIRRNFYGKIGQTIIATENTEKFWRIWSGVC